MPETQEDANCVFIGKKQTMNYVFAVQTQAQVHNEIRIRARGRCMSKAIDVEQICLRRFLKGWSSKSIITGTEERKVAQEDGSSKSDPTSFIDIRIQKEQFY